MSSSSQPPEKESLIPRRVVAIGASAGGLRPIREFIQQIPLGLGCAYIVMQHLDPNRKSRMSELASAWTRLPVVEALHLMVLRPDVIYLIPEGVLATVKGDRFFLVPVDRKGRNLAPITELLLSLADSLGQRAVGIILSGAGNDGSLGIKAIHEAGGLTLVQEPTAARFSSMPEAAIATGCVTRVTAAEAMPHLIQAQLLNKGSEADSLQSSQEIGGGQPISNVLEEIVALVSEASGNDFRGYKATTIGRRVDRRVGLRNVADYASYLALLRQEPQEALRLAEDMLIGVTSFYRDPQAFDCFREQVVPQLFNKDVVGEPIRVWVAGCASGEEAYTIAAALHYYKQQTGKTNVIQIFASDIDVSALACARSGVYGAEAVQRLPEALREIAFLRQQELYRVRKDVRDTLVFAIHNLVSDPPFSRIDLVVCRNVLIYLDQQAQQDVMQVFAAALKPGGYLFLGGSEAVAANVLGQFEVVSKPWRLFRSIPGAHPMFARGVAVGRSNGSLRGIQREPGDLFQSRSMMHDLKLRQVLERHGPAQFVLSAKAEILYSTGEINRYVEMPAGRPVFELFSLLLPQLRTLVRSLFNQALDLQQPYLGYMRLADDKTPIRVSVRPIVEPLGETLYLLGLEPEVGKEVPVTGLGQGDNWAVEQLEQELQLTREDLNQTIEKLSLSNEELKAVNEEFMAMNEELQSANEELESSKEELQSLNEELQTTNVTLDAKVLELEKVNDDLSNLFSSTDLATLFLDLQLLLKRFTSASRRIVALIDSDIGRPLTDIANELIDHDILEGAQDVMSTGLVKEFEVQDRRGNWYIKRVLPYRKVDQCVDGVVMTFADVTALRRTRDKAEALASKLQKQAQLLDLPLVFARDMEDRIIFWNLGAQQLYGWTTEEALGQISHILLKTQFPTPLAEIRRQIAVRRRWQGELIHQTKSGHAIAVNSQWVVALDSKGQPWATVEVNTDISERKVFQDQLDFLLHHDPLTQLPNQVVLNNKLAAALRAAELANTRVALIFLDLDRFKTINDSLGHEIGNQLLVAVAHRIAGVLQTGCTLTRFGGDEFAAVVEGFKDLNRVTHLACTLLESLKAPFTIGGHELYAGASLGISLFPDDSRDQEELIRYSDSALNLAKEEGRGQYKFFTPELNRKAHRALAIETRLRKSLENNELTIVYQPQVSSMDGRIVGAEALVRWYNPELGQVSPGEFIPIAEESGFILELGNWVFEEVFGLMQRWYADSFPVVRISLNISPVQFRQPAFLQLIEQRIKSAKFPASMIELELTERILVGAPELAIEYFGQLQRLGLRLAFDDFGTGYCSLQYLRHLRLSHLKVAREFIPFDNNDLDNIAIARSIISLAKSLEIDCTVEGVESEAQLAFFEPFGELSIQGFLFSRPLPLNEFETLLRSGAPLQPRKR